MSRTTRSGYYFLVGLADTTRDKKKWYKPDIRYKKMKKKIQKAKIKDCDTKSKEIPRDYKNIIFDWN